MLSASAARAGSMCPGPNVGPFHWENRRLRVGEMKRLFTFPDEFGLVGTRASIQAQLGNAVPMKLAKVVARSLAKTLESQPGVSPKDGHSI